MHYDENQGHAATVAPGAEATYYGCDPLNLLSHVRADAFDTDAVTYCLYDPAVNTTRIVDAKAHPTYFAYDPLDRLSSETDAIGNVEDCAYDANGDLVAHTNGDGQSTYYVYDALDRLVQINGPGDLHAQFAYDAVGNLISATGGHPTYRYGHQPYGTSLYGGSLPQAASPAGGYRWRAARHRPSRASSPGTLPQDSDLREETHPRRRHPLLRKPAETMKPGTAACSYLTSVARSAKLRACHDFHAS